MPMRRSRSVVGRPTPTRPLRLMHMMVRGMEVRVVVLVLVRMRERMLRFPPHAGGRSASGPSAHRHDRRRRPGGGMRRYLTRPRSLRRGRGQLGAAWRSTQRLVRLPCRPGLGDRPVCIRHRLERRRSTWLASRLHPVRGRRLVRLPVA